MIAAHRRDDRVSEKPALRYAKIVWPERSEQPLPDRKAGPAPSTSRGRWWRVLVDNGGIGNATGGQQSVQSAAGRPLAPGVVPNRIAFHVEEHPSTGKSRRSRTAPGVAVAPVRPRSLPHMEHALLRIEREVHRQSCRKDRPMVIGTVVLKPTGIVPP